jgi:hypothetical protein
MSHFVTFFLPFLKAPVPNNIFCVRKCHHENHSKGYLKGYYHRHYDHMPYGSRNNCSNFLFKDFKGLAFQATKMRNYCIFIFWFLTQKGA